MRAIILAAGMGKRLGEYTKNNTKCMVPVNGVPLIDRVLNQLSSLKLSRVVIVVGYEGQKLIDYIGNEYNGLKIEYIFNSIYDKTNNIYSERIGVNKSCGKWIFGIGRVYHAEFAKHQILCNRKCLSMERCYDK